MYEKIYTEYAHLTEDLKTWWRFGFWLNFSPRMGLHHNHPQRHLVQKGLRMELLTSKVHVFNNDWSNSRALVYPKTFISILNDSGIAFAEIGTRDRDGAQVAAGELIRRMELVWDWIEETPQHLVQMCTQAAIKSIFFFWSDRRADFIQIDLPDRDTWDHSWETYFGFSTREDA